MRGLTEHWDGAQWSIVPNPTISNTTYLWGVAAIASNDVWATGQGSANGRYVTVTLHWNGTQWSVVPSPNVGTYNTGLSLVSARATNDVWTVGHYEGYLGVATLIEHWDGTQWTIVPSPNVNDPVNAYYHNYLIGVQAVASNDVWAMGNYYVDRSAHALIEHWDGTQWSLMDTGNSPTFSSELEGVAALSSGDVWAVGSYQNESNVDQTLVERYNDPCSTPTPTVTPTFSPTVTPTSTPTPNRCSVCNLSVQRVVISCNPDGTVHWTATVRNQAACPVYDNWHAQLQVKVGRGSQFVTVREQSGSTSFGHGNTTVSGDMCYLFSTDTRAVKVEFSPGADGARCNPHARSDAIAPCAHAAICP